MDEDVSDLLDFIVIEFESFEFCNFGKIINGLHFATVKLQILAFNEQFKESFVFWSDIINDHLIENQVLILSELDVLAFVLLYDLLFDLHYLLF